MTAVQRIFGSSPRPWVYSILGAFALSLGLNLIWWGLLRPDPPPEVTEFVIEPGTAEAIANGQPAFVPNSIQLLSGGYLLVRNNDYVPHQIAGVTLQPGEVAEIDAPSDNGQLTCTIHPSGYLGVQLKEKPPITTMLGPTAILTAMLGIPLGVIMRISQALQFDGPGHAVAG